MLYHWLFSFSQQYGLFNIFKYITLRSFIGFILAAIISIIWGRYFIAYMKKRQFGQVVRDDGPQSHKKKAGTPTFGGVFIVGTIFIVALLVGNFHSLPFILVLILTLSYFLLGWLDDYLKVLKKNSDGVSAKIKLLWQFLSAAIVMYVAVKYEVINTQVYVPFLKGALIDLGSWYILFGSFVIVGSSNAVNLTDGLDGLAIGPIITSAATLGALAYVTGHIEISEYLYVPYVRGAGELVVISALIVGAGVGFLWYNSYPAQIFMGDVGSLSIGGALGLMAVLIKNEILFVLIGGIFVIEALSVILQVGSYKLRKKRIFKMAPIHHHFELKGWAEPKVIVRFWIVSIILAILSIATLKLR
jgi:phospho-N-acetylmuramoyl-pentapeptide-transferase